MRHEPAPKRILIILTGDTHCDHLKIAIASLFKVWDLNTFLLNLVELCLLQQIMCRRSDVRSEKDKQNLLCSLEYSLLDS